MKKIFAQAIVASVLAVSAPAMAATTLVNPTCTLSVGTSCLFNGNINLNLTGNNSLGDADAAYNSQTPTPSPLLDLGDMTFKMDDSTGFGANQMSGTITAPFEVTFYAVKAGDFFDLFEIAPSTTFNWSTAGISVGSGQQPAISHIEFFGMNSAVPEPATWAMMILGLACVGGVLRQRRQVAQAA
jgi:hypothetical protein